MSVTPLAARLSRPLAAVGTAVVILGTAPLAPQAASARPTDARPAYISCSSAPISTLVDEGSVVDGSGESGAGFYTVGGRDFLGTDAGAIRSVAQVAPGSYRAVPRCG